MSEINKPTLTNKQISWLVRPPGEFSGATFRAEPIEGVQTGSDLTYQIRKLSHRAGREQMPDGRIVGYAHPHSLDEICGGK